MKPLLILLALMVGGYAFAQDPALGSELDAQLSQMVKIPAPRVAIHWEGLEEPPYQLTHAEMTLDGRSLPLPGVDKLDQRGPTPVYEGDVGHGQHVLVIAVTFVDQNSPVFSFSGGTEWKVQTRVAFMAQRGLESRVTVRASRDPSARNKKEAFRVSSQVIPVMIAKLEDGNLPPPPKPHLGEPDEPDAQIKLAAAQTQNADRLEPAVFREQAAPTPSKKSALRHVQPVVLTEAPAPDEAALAKPAMTSDAPSGANPATPTPVAQELRLQVLAVETQGTQAPETGPYPGRSNGWIPLAISGVALLLALLLIGSQRRGREKSSRSTDPL